MATTDPILPPDSEPFTSMSVAVDTCSRCGRHADEDLAGWAVLSVFGQEGTVRVHVYCSADCFAEGVIIPMMACSQPVKLDD